MTRSTRVLAIAAVLLALVEAAASAQTGLEIMEKQRALQRSRDEQEIVVMRLVSKSGETKERRMASYLLTGADDRSKTLLRFLAPRDIENTGLLTWEGDEGDDDQWLYLPATRRAKRIPSSGKKNRFMGTDFAFEDLRPESLSLYKYALIGSESIDGQDTFVVEAEPATSREAADSGYSKRKFWIRKDIYFTVKREFYDKRQRLEKVETSRNLINVKGSHWRANEIEMNDVQAGSRTVVLSQSRALDKGLKDAFFTEAELTRGAR
jgi:outer membrane lipoprotein-sorting protein